MKKTYDPRRGPRPGDYGYVMDPTAPVQGLAKVITKPDPGDPDESFLVEFVESHPLLHSGGDRCRNEHGWWIRPDEITPVDAVGEIMGFGGHMYCRVGNRVGHAKCDANDEFDPLTGAIIALARAYKTNPTKAAYKVLQVMSAVPTAGVESQPSTMKIVDRGGRSYGVPGTPTRYRDSKRTALCVGDTVKIRYGDYTFETWVVETKDEGQFIMGICMDCDSRTGKVDTGWEITWLRSWKELKPGDTECHGLKIVGGPEKETPAPEKKRLYLESGTEKHCGVLGAPTDLVDLFNAPLCVGDVVKVISSHGEKGEEPVVGSSLGEKNPFVMGCAGVDFTKPGVSGGFAIRKVKNYTDLKLGDKLSDGWITVKEETYD